jgi:hypothetical protein
MTIRNFLLAMMLAGVSAFSGMAQAQDTGDSDTTAGAGSSGGAGRGQRLSFLSAQDRQHLLRVRRQVLAGDPDLKSEQESLMKEAQSVKSQGTGASADDKQMLRNNFMAHREKMNAAMVKADPTVQPILDQVDAHLKARFQQSGGGEASNP